MDALVSGQAGVVVLIQGNDTSVVRVDEFEKESWCSPSAIAYLLDGAHDVVQLKSVTKQEALKTP